MVQRLFSLIALGVLALGPALFWSPKQTPQAAFSSGWTAVPLPQQLLEVSSKLSAFGLWLALILLGGQTPLRSKPAVQACPSYAHTLRPRRLYLVYSRLQTDGG